jgi:NAD(P)-dependent dehydrogenase (short-subunit alcohol dehydrogenase family)
MSELKDKVVLITGAGKGSGRRLAGAFAAQGAIVAANDISPINVEAVVAQIKAQGGRAAAYTHDVAKKVAVQVLVKEVEDQWGRIDVLINHASVEPHSPLLEMDEWDWHRVLDVNLTGAFLMIQSVGRVMRAQGAGVIVNLISGADPGGRPERAEGAEIGRGAYLASMGGLLSLSHQAAAELAPEGVRFHAVEMGGENLVETVIELCRA